MCGYPVSASCFRNDRTPAEHRRFLAQWREWRAQADADFRQRRDDLLDRIEPFDSLALLGHIFFAETFANPETYKEWAHRGLAAKVEHFALLLLIRGTHAKETIVPLDVIADVNEYLDYLFSHMSMYYENFDKGAGSPTDPDPRSLVLMWELVVRMPIYAWQFRSTLRELFTPVKGWMEQALGFDIEDVIAIELAFEKLDNEDANRELRDLQSSMEAFRKVVNRSEEGFLPKPGHEDEAIKLYDEFQRNWALTMANLGKSLKRTAKEVASAAQIEETRAAAVLRFFTTSSGDIPTNYALPVPNGPLKFRPFIEIEGGWILPSPTLLLPATQATLERAANPDLRAATADKVAWNSYEKNRADILETRTLSALSRLLDGATFHRNLKYKVPGQPQPFELDGLCLHDRKLFLCECKAGAFTSTARSGDIDAVEGRIKALVTDAHSQAVRALDYIENQAQPTFRIGTSGITIDKSMFDEVFLIATTLEELGYLTAPFNEVKRLTTTSLKQVPWVVSLHDLEIIAKYMPTSAEFIHYLRLRIQLNDNVAMRAFDELDWLGRYFYDCLEIAELREVMDSGEAITGSLISHSTEFDDFEHFENGVRTTPAKRPTTGIPDSLKIICANLGTSQLSGYLDAGTAFLELPHKLRRGFAKRIRQAATRVRKNGIAQEKALARGGRLQIVCTDLWSGDKRLRGAGSGHR